MSEGKARRFYLWLLGILAVVLGFTLLPERLKPAWLGAARERLAEMLGRPYFHVGETAVTPGFLLQTLLFLILLGVAASLVRRVLQNRLLPLTAMERGQQYALARIAAYLVFTVGLIVGLHSAGLKMDTLLIVGGAIGIGIGFGLQEIANNFISGLILLIERPIKVGDRVEVGNTLGDVIRIAGRSTWVRTNDNVVIIVPNSEFTATRVTNWTANDPQVRLRIPVGVSYGSDPDRVRDVLVEVARQHPDVLPAPAPDVLFRGFGESALEMELRIWTVAHVHRPGVLVSDLYFAIFRAFREQGIEIPFPQRDLHLKSVHAPLTVSQSG